jgi:hypothetical protein
VREEDLSQEPLTVRKYLNGDFLVLAICSGVICSIANPLVKEIGTAVRASDSTVGRDAYALRWNNACRARQLAGH